MSPQITTNGSLLGLHCALYELDPAYAKDPNHTDLGMVLETSEVPSGLMALAEGFMEASEDQKIDRVRRARDVLIDLMVERGYRGLSGDIIRTGVLQSWGSYQWLRESSQPI